MSNLLDTQKFLRGKNVTLDCNIFLLYVIGSIGKEHISKFKRTRIFSEEDFELLNNLVKESYVVITPNVLTEASNLLESYSFNNEKIGLLALKKTIQNTIETYRSSVDLVKLQSFDRYGLSDSSIDMLCQNDVVAITVDLPLYGYLIGKSYTVLNFNHVRF